jgi:hypothetical protein
MTRRRNRSMLVWLALLPLVVAVLALSVAGATSVRAESAAPAVQAESVAPPGLDAVGIGGKVEADNACYVRLPNLPEARSGGLGAYNPDTGVLVYAGGADKQFKLTIASYDMWAIKLDGSMTAWAPIPYSAASGYLREFNRGCQGAADIPLSATNWASVGGKSGCDGSSATMGDIKELHVGARADGTEVRWVPNTGANLSALPPILRANSFRLGNPFAAYDVPRQRIVFGQGAFNGMRDSMTRGEVYYATATGATWSIRQMFPDGPAPEPRYGSCAAYIGDPEQGLDGIIVLGGIQGGPTGTPVAAYKEVWWLDFSADAQGKWVNLTARFSSWKECGARRDGSCAYDPETKYFYSWMGRSDANIADGASHSAGIWRADLAHLGDPTAKLAWERLGKDKQTDIAGRRYVGNVYDLTNNRFFAIGGVQGNVVYNDVWAIYPDVVGDACQNLDPYAPFRDPVAPTPVPPPTATPLPPDPEVCQLARSSVPPAVVSAALTNPDSVVGHGQLCNPKAPESTINHTRDRLSVEDPGRPYHRLYNALAWKCGCP